MKNKIIITIIISCLFSTFSYANWRPTIGFFNGMLNSRDAAENNLGALKNVVSNNEVSKWFTSKNIPPIYVLFYNNTEGMSDLVEVFKQLKAEEENGTISNPRTLKDYQNHEIFVGRALQQNTGLMLVGHSQGNFFLNRAYNYCRRNAKSIMQCNAIHIGSPSDIKKGPFILSNNDKIIQSFYALTGRSMYSNVTIPFSITEPTGHSFVDTYLNSSKPARSKIVTAIDDAMSMIFSPI